MGNLPQRSLKQVLTKVVIFHFYICRRASLKSSWSLWIVYLRARTKQSIPLWVTRHHASSVKTEVLTKTSNQRTSLIFKLKMSFNQSDLFVKYSCGKSLVLEFVVSFLNSSSLLEKEHNRNTFLFIFTWTRGLCDT